MKTSFLKLVALSMMTLACGKKEEAEMGSVKVGFAKNASLSLATPKGSTGTITEYGKTYQAYAASTLSLKFVQIYLIPDIAPDLGNIGAAGLVWVNPACPTVTNEDGSVMIGNEKCDASKITEYFELARPADEVNAALNAQQIPVYAQTYKYIRLQLCDNDQPLNARVASTSGGMSKVTDVKFNNCVFNVKIDPPLTLGKGEAAELSLSYDLNRALIDMNYNITEGTYNQSTDSTSCGKAEDGKGVRCVTDLSFSAAVSKK